MRVFMELVHDTDRNLGNVLVSPDVAGDHARLHPRVPAVPDDSRQRAAADRPGAARRARDADRRRARDLATKDYLSTREVDAVIKRRDLIVEHFRARVKQLGEARVLY